MRRLALLLPLFAACVPPASGARDVCEKAHQLIESCGASLPTLENEPCTGFNKVVSKCIAEHAGDCDELATLNTRLDECVGDGGDELLPSDTEIPLTNDFIRDGGFHDGGS